MIYLDYNCFQRGFDDPQQVKIQMEALACSEIFRKAEKKVIKLIWSFMHEDENILCPFLERKLAVDRLSSLCTVRIGPDKQLYIIARDFQLKAKLSAKDAIHLACAYHGQCKYFLTCDDRLIRRAKRLNLELRIMNPVEYIREVDR